NPITRALRIDKLTLAALESTLRLYRDEGMAVQAIPTLRMMLQPITTLEEKAGRLKKMLESAERIRLTVASLDLVSRPGGGSLPLLELPSKGLGIRIDGLSANAIEKSLRLNSPPIIGRIEDDLYTMDMRTLQDDELETIRNAIETLLT
ncbi:MAG: L-seryl-tRNA(Sec) selenium transferase, partial [Desulfobacterales bacterium]